MTEAAILRSLSCATAVEGSAFGFVATATDADLPVQPLTFALAGTIPAGAAIDPASGAFTWTPDEAQGPGAYAFTVEVSDGLATSSAAIEITVSEANLAPVIADVPASAHWRQSRPEPRGCGGDHYRILHLRETAPVELIESAYRVLARLNHPDAGGSTEAMQQINGAYAALRERVTA